MFNSFPQMANFRWALADVLGVDDLYPKKKRQNPGIVTITGLDD
jgi:hypothetical protein